MDRERGIRDVEVDGRHGTILKVEMARVLVRWDDGREDWVPVSVATEKAAESLVREVGS